MMGFYPCEIIKKKKVSFVILLRVRFLGGRSKVEYRVKIVIGPRIGSQHSLRPRLSFKFKYHAKVGKRTLSTSIHL